MFIISFGVFMPINGAFIAMNRAFMVSFVPFMTMNGAFIIMNRILLGINGAFIPINGVLMYINGALITMNRAFMYMNDGQFSGFAASFPLEVILIGEKYKGTKISDFSAPC